MEKKLTGYDEIETLEKNAIFSFEVYRSMTLFDMKKFIILDHKVVFIRDNQFKWEFDISDECVSKIRSIIQENERLADIYSICDTDQEDIDNYKFTFYDHVIYTTDITYPEENGMIVKWNSDFDQVIENLNYLLNVFYKIVDELDASSLELDIKREFQLEQEIDEPFHKKIVVAKEKKSETQCWILNMDHMTNKYPWSIEYNGTLRLGWFQINEHSLDSKFNLSEAIKRAYGSKCATSMNVDTLWTLINEIQCNDIIYLVHHGRIEFKLMAQSGFHDGKLMCKKAYYCPQVPFNANRFSKNLLEHISKEDSLIQYFDGLEDKDRIEVFPTHSTIYVGPIEAIKELKVRKQRVYLLNSYKNDSVVNVYKDKENHYYIANNNDEEGYHENYRFEAMEIEEPIQYEVDEGEPVKILSTDFLTCSSLSHCRHHKLVHITIRVQIVDSQGNICEVYSPAYFCKDCNRTYLLYEDMERIKNYGIILCKLVDDSYWKENTTTTYRGYNEESMLHLLGYNVTQKDKLSDAQRWRILENAVDEGILSKEEVCQFLDFLMNSRGSAANMETALQKWKKDKKHIQEYELKSKPVTIFKKIYLNEYIRLL